MTARAVFWVKRFPALGFQSHFWANKLGNAAGSRPLGILLVVCPKTAEAEVVGYEE